MLLVKWRERNDWNYKYWPIVARRRPSASAAANDAELEEITLNHSSVVGCTSQGSTGPLGNQRGHGGCLRAGPAQSQPKTCK